MSATEQAWESVFVLLDEAERPAFERWVPNIGVRVRVRLSAECQTQFADRRRGLTNLPHESWQDGRTGTVEDVKDKGSHPYQVTFDEYEATVLGLCVGWHFAAIELEPLDWDGTASDGTDDRSL